MTVQERLEELAAKGYTVGVAAAGDDGEALSYRVIGFGLDTTVPAADPDESLDSFEATHDERAAEEAKDPEVREAELAAATAKLETDREARIAKLTARIEASNLPVGVKTILEEIAEAALTR